MHSKDGAPQLLRDFRYLMIASALITGCTTRVRSRCRRQRQEGHDDAVQYGGKM